MPKKQTILLLTDGAGGTVGADLDILYPGRVKRVNFTEEKHGVRHVLGENLRKLDYKAVISYAKGGGQVLSCLF